MDFKILTKENSYGFTDIITALEGSYNEATEKITIKQVPEDCRVFLELVSDVGMYAIEPEELDTWDFRLRLLKGNITDLDCQTCTQWLSYLENGIGIKYYGIEALLEDDEPESILLLKRYNEVLEVIANSNIDYIACIPSTVKCIDKDVYEKLVNKFERFNIENYVEKAFNDFLLSNSIHENSIDYSDFIKDKNIALEFINKTLDRYQNFETPAINDRKCKTWAFVGNRALYLTLNMIYKLQLELTKEQSKKLYGVLRDASELGVWEEVYEYVYQQTDKYTKEFINTTEFVESLRNSATGPVRMLKNQLKNLDDLSGYKTLYYNCKPNTKIGLKSFFNMYQIQSLLHIESEPPAFTLPKLTEEEFKQAYNKNTISRAVLINDFKTHLELWDDDTIEKNEYYIREFLRRVCLENYMIDFESCYLNTIHLSTQHKEEILFKHLINCVEEISVPLKLFQLLIVKLIKSFESESDYEIKRVYRRYNPGHNNQTKLENLKKLEELILSYLEPENKRTLKAIKKAFATERKM